MHKEHQNHKIGNDIPTSYNNQNTKSTKQRKLKEKMDQTTY